MTYWDGHWQPGHFGLIETLLVELPEISPKGVVSIVLAASCRSQRDKGNPLSMKDVKSIIQYHSHYLFKYVYKYTYISLNIMHVDIILYIYIYVNCS